jgi:molybdopterin-guanine dinucleotide biosynthesis protein A
MSAGFSPQPPKGDATYQKQFSAQPLFFVLLERRGAQIVLSSMAKAGAKRKPNLRYNAPPVQRSNAEICILAGGLSKRMGRDKSRLRLGSTTMLSYIRKTAEATGLPVRVIRRDFVPKCGPLGGIYTALKTTKADAILFLACDMPLVTVELIQFTLQRAAEATSCLARHPHSHSAALFVRSRGRAGFPFILCREAFETVDRQIRLGDYSLQGLAKSLRATILTVTRAWSQQLFNVNNPKDLTAVKRHFQRASRTGGKPRVGLHSGRN